MIDFKAVRQDANYKVFSADEDRVLDLNGLYERFPKVQEQEVAVVTGLAEPLPAPQVYTPVSLEKIMAKYDTAAAGARFREAILDALDGHEAVKSDVILSVLTDNRGGLRGYPFVCMAAAIGVVTTELSALGIKHEILGHTTDTWKLTDKQRELLYAERDATGIFPQAGRLGALLHAIWKGVEDDGTGLAAKMVDFQARRYLKENVDGEAVEWAYSRIAARPEPIKLMLSLKSGSLDPISDVTNRYNSDQPQMLQRHLARTVAAIRSEGKVHFSTAIFDQFRSQLKFGWGTAKGSSTAWTEEMIEDVFGKVPTIEGHEFDDIVDLMSATIAENLKDCLDRHLSKQLTP